MNRIDIFPGVDGEIAYVDLDGPKVAELIVLNKTDSVFIEVRQNPKGFNFPAYIHYRNLLRNGTDGKLYLDITRQGKREVLQAVKGY